MDDLEAAGFELFQNFGEGERRRGLDVMQQQDALAAGLDAADGASRDLLGVDVGPVVGCEIHAPGHVVVRGKVLLDRILAQQAGNAKERGDRFRITAAGCHCEEASTSCCKRSGRAALALPSGLSRGMTNWIASRICKFTAWQVPANFGWLLNRGSNRGSVRRATRWRLHGFELVIGTYSVAGFSVGIAALTGYLVVRGIDRFAGNRNGLRLARHSI